MMLALGYAMVGQPADGLNCLAEAARIIETTEERSSEATLHRLRGDLLNVDLRKEWTSACYVHSMPQAVAIYSSP